MFCKHIPPIGRHIHISILPAASEGPNAGEEDAIARYKLRIDQPEELKEFALAQHLRNILSVEQEHAMDLVQALGRPHVAAGVSPAVSGAATS